MQINFIKMFFQCSIGGKTIFIKNKCFNCCIIKKEFVPLQCGSKERTARATSQPILKWLKKI